MGWLPEGEKHKSRSTEFDARIFPVIQGHFVMPGGHYFSNVIILIPMYKPISVHFDVIATRKEYSWIWKGKMNLCLIYSFFDASDVNLQMLKPKVGVKLAEARWSSLKLVYKTTNFRPLIGKINVGYSFEFCLILEGIRLFQELKLRYHNHLV